ncbi:MFS transporter [Streptomyces sp. NPDC051079]|uniref:MFS transporter n=1 Tax=Streptomyces sp. NPDC051079 TaxID=3155043 RepID=UPI00344BC9A0
MPPAPPLPAVTVVLDRHDDTLHTPTAPPDGLSPRRWWGLAAAVLAQFLVLVASMTANVAMPIIQADLHLSLDDLWLMSGAYVIAFGVLLLFGGHLADLLGRKRVAITALAGFAVASAVGGAAPTAGVLIAAHALQGVFAALLSSAALALVAGGFTDPKTRGTAFGIYAVFAGGGLAVGAFAGGWLAENLSWRWSLYAAVPLALMALVPAALFVDDRSPRTPARPDVPGLLLGTGTLAALAFGFHRVEVGYRSSDADGGGWTAPLTMLLLLVGAALLVTFVWWQTRTSSPLVQRGLFQDRDRAGSLLALVLAGVGTPTLFLVLSLYLQSGLGYSPAELGLSLLPMAGAVLVATQVTGYLQGRIAPRLLAVPGLALAAAGLGLLTRLELDSSYASAVLPGIALVGLGLGTALGPLLATATGPSGFQSSGGTAGTVLAAQGLGTWLAVPLFGSIVTSAVSSSLDELKALPQPLAQAARNGVLINPRMLPTAAAESVAQTNTAVLDAYSAVLWTTAGLLLLAGLLAGLMVTTSTPRRDR